MFVNIGYCSMVSIEEIREPNSRDKSTHRIVWACAKCNCVFGSCLRNGQLRNVGSSLERHGLFHIGLRGSATEE